MCQGGHSGGLRRRDWLMLAASSFEGAAGQDSPARVMTVTGAVRAADLGRTLTHEHVLIDFVGAALLKPGRYDPEEAFAVVRPVLEQAKAAGLGTLVEATPEHMGRDAVLLRRLSESTGVQIIASTGIYAARKEQYIPGYARVETAEQLAARYRREFERGIGQTGIRPGVIKMGVNPKPAPLSEIERKLVRAAALAHLGTGLTVECHTDRGHAAIEQMEIFADVKAPPRAFIWVHAHHERDHAFHLKVARAGGWVEFDGLRAGHLANSYTSMDWHVECLGALKEAGLLRQALISSDAGWYQVGERKGGPYHGYTLPFREFLPRLEASGFTASEIGQLFVRNPARALTPAG
ncbi:MAG: phosphotriesterase [Bryobacteraceae bacterium]